MLHFVVALQVLAAAPAQSPGDSAKLVDRARGAMRDFFVEWRREWTGSEIRARKRFDIIPDTFEVMATNCNNSDAFGGPSADTVRNGEGDLMRVDRQQRPLSGLSRGTLDYYGSISHPNRIANPSNIVNVNFDVCPIWTTNNFTSTTDARRSIDQELDLIRRSRAQWVHRRPLLLLLDTIAKKIPGDPWIAGQRVRFYLDQARLLDAIRATEECRAAQWWCIALRGFAHYRDGDLALAATYFRRSVAVMPDDERCKWTSIASLLPPDEKRRYDAMSCSEQAGVNARYWWLADPLYLEDGNARETEHFGRKMTVALVGSMDLDERWDWRPMWGGVARAALVERYGWPTRMRFWGASFTSPFGLLGPAPEPAWIDAGARDKRAREELTRTVRQYSTAATTIEYWGPQFHTTPALAWVDNPFSIADSAWRIGPLRWGPARWDTTLYWPYEFYRRDAGELLGLDHQTAYFHRARTTYIAAAAAWDSTDGFVGPPRTMTFGLVTSAGPDDEMSFSLQELAGRDTARALRPIRPVPQLLGLEMMSAPRPGAARRARMGISPPTPIRSDTVALSEPMFIDPDTAAVADMNLRRAVSTMLPTTTLRRPRRVGVYWEAYGLPAGDTTQVAFRVIRVTDPGVLSRMLGAVGLGPSRDTVTARWTPGPATAAAEVDGFRVTPGSLTLNVELLDAGDYILEIVMEPAGRSVALARRTFRVVR